MMESEATAVAWANINVALDRLALLSRVDGVLVDIGHVQRIREAQLRLITKNIEILDGNPVDGFISESA